MEQHSEHTKTGVVAETAHRAATREVVSSTPAGPTLMRVLKQLSRKCCLCNYISKWLDFQVFSDKDYKPSHNTFYVYKFNVRRYKEPTHYSKRVGREVSRCCGCPLCCSFRVGALHRDNLMHLSPLGQRKMTMK